jgi:biopolymer transport protein ExbD
LRYSVIIILVVIPIVTFFGWIWAQYPHSTGFLVRLNKPSKLTADAQGERVIVSVRCVNGCAVPAEPEVFLNTKRVALVDFGGELRAELSRHADPVIYVEGDRNLEVATMLRVIKVARAAQNGVRVVLLTPALKKSLDADRP